LARKLGIRSGQVVLLMNAPEGFEQRLTELPDDVEVSREPGEPADVVVSFHTVAATIPDGLRAVRRVDGGLWVAWPKRSSGVPTDIIDHVVREIALPTGLVDNKVCAIDAVWTGLRLVMGTELRRDRTTI
jgi:hypothetical protein